MIQLLLLVGRILTLANPTHAIPLDRLGQNDRRLAPMVGGAVESGIDLVRVMTTAIQAPDIGVCHLADEFEQSGVLPKKLPSYVGAIIGFEALIFAVKGLHHDPLQDAILVAG